ncbi:TauD/TfdA family dioxygenase [Ahniella affigens]|nr:TauD/TfdA family dioxygenase [Ahniella affigens]
MSAVMNALSGGQHELPVVVGPPRRDTDIVAWVKAERETLGRHLHTIGGVLFRGWRINGLAHFERLMTEGLGREPLEYRNQSTPRSEVRGRIYSSTEYPADQHIELHNENAYTSAWAERILFYCVKASDTGGETPIADSRRVLQRIPDAVRARFEQHGVMYVRNYDGLDLPWQTVFQTTDRESVVAQCVAAGIQWEWLGGDRLRTREVAQATLAHPITSEPVWFNQAHLFHVSALHPTVRAALAGSMDERDYPRNAYFGDGSPISDSDLAQIRAAYAAETIAAPWQVGDILLLDNVLVAHGRRPFTGARKIVVGMV